MDPPHAHDFGQFSGWHDPEEVDVLREEAADAVSSLKVFLASSYLPHIMDLRAHEVSRGSHFPEGTRGVVQPLMLIIRPMGLVIVSPSCSDEF